MINKNIKDILVCHKGANNAITANEIASLCCISKSEGNPYIRKKILEVIDEYNIPIGANKNGYYLISNFDEYTEYIDHLNNRIKEILKRETLINKNYLLFYDEVGV